MEFFRDLYASRAPALGFAAMGLVWAGFAAQVPVLKAQIEASDALFGMIFLIGSIGALVSVWSAPVVDRFLGVNSIAFANVALALAILIPAFTDQVVLFVIGIVLASAASGVGDIVMNARISEIEDMRRRPLMNLNHAVYSFAYAGSALFTGALREAGVGPPVVFLAIGTLIILLSPVMRIVPKAPVSQEEQSDAARAGARILVWLAGLVVLVAFMAEQAVEGWSALHLERTLGGDASEGAMGPAILGLTMGFGRLFGQLIARHVRDIALIACACVMAALGVMLAAFATTLALAYLGFAIMGLGVSVVVPLTMALVGRTVPDHERVGAIGRASVIGYGAFLIGPSLMGVTSDFAGLSAAFVLIGLMLLTVAFPLIPMIARRMRQVA